MVKYNDYSFSNIFWNLAIKRIKKVENVNEEKLMETSKIKVNQAVALIRNIYEKSPIINSQAAPNEGNSHNDGKQSVLQESIKKGNEEDKLLGEISNMFSDKNKKVQEHEVINRELLAPHKYILTIPKSQKILYKQFQSNLREKYLASGKYSIYILFLIYLIETLILSNVSIYNENKILVFILRGIFNACNLLTAILFVQTNWRETYTYIILGIFAFGIIVNALETIFLVYTDLHVVKLVEFIFLYVVHVNLQ